MLSKKKVSHSERACLSGKCYEGGPHYPWHEDSFMQIYELDQSSTVEYHQSNLEAARLEVGSTDLLARL